MSKPDWRLIDEPFIAYLPSLAKDLGSPIRAIIMQTLWFARNPEGETAMTQATLADRTGIPVRTIRDHVKWLRENGHLHTRRSKVWDATTVWVVTLDGEPPSDDEPGPGDIADAPAEEPESADSEEERHLDAADLAASSGQEADAAVSMRRISPGLDAADLATSSSKNYEEDAAAVLEAGDQQQPDEMDEAVKVVADELGGTVIADTQQPRVYVCDGCMRPVVREQIADMADGEHVLCHGCKDGAPHGGESIAEAMARGGHGIRGTYLNPNPQPGNVRPFPPVEQRKLENWFHVTDGDPWLAAWTTACSAPTDVWYDPEAHLAIYLSKCREEGRKPRSDLWLRFFIEDRAKHIQVLQQQQDAALRREEDPQQREDRSNRSLPPVGWGTGEGE